MEQTKQPANWIVKQPIIEDQVTTGFLYVSDKGAIMIKKLDQHGNEKFVVCLQQSQAAMVASVDLGELMRSEEYVKIVSSKTSKYEQARAAKLIQNEALKAQVALNKLKDLGLTPEQLSKLLGA